MKAAVKQPNIINDQPFQNRTTTSKQAILDTLIDYDRFAHNPIAGASPEVKQAYATTLAMRYELPPGVPEMKNKLPESPHLGRPPGWFQIGTGRNTRLGNSITLQSRPAYYDALDADSGHVKNGSLSMGDFRAALYADKLRIEWLDIIRIESVNPGISQLPGDRGNAWGLRLGTEQARLWCDNCLVVRAQGDIGYSRQFSESTFVAAFLGGAVQSNRASQGLGFFRGSTVLVSELSPMLRVRLAYEYHHPFTQRTKDYSVFNATARWSLGDDLDLRLTIQRDQAKQFNFGIGYYW